MIYRVMVSGSEWLTIIVRAKDEEEAAKLGLQEAANYHGAEPNSREAIIDHLDANGTAEVLVVDDA